ncbi:MAG: BACON domain-containing protein [Bacteroidales bacterium]|nr:BACON domain-containing protein [Bacteroidales bacterium]
MKAKYIFASLVAALAVLAGCQKEVTTHYLDEVSVSSSYVSIPLDGGSTPIGVLAQGSWTISGVPSWLTVSPVSGSAGSSNVTFSAEKALDGRTAEVLLTCNGATQRINVIQGLATVSNATCAEVNAGPDSKTYRVTGTVTNIVNTTYGNWYLEDATGSIYIYGTLDAKGNEKNFLSLGIEVGDEVTVEGPKTTYGTTVELVNVTVIKINKSLIKVAEMDPENAQLPVEGGNFTVTLENKGNGVYVEIPEDAQDWLSIASIAGNVVTFKAAANQGGDRETLITFKTTDGKKDYTAQQTLSQKGAIVECSVADFLAAEVGNTQYRITGVITKVARADYGNVYIRDWSGEAYVYGIGAKGDFEKLGLKVGDIVTLVGKRGEYKGDAQMTGGQYESHISVTEVSLADFLAKPDSKTAYYMVTATVKDLLDNNGKTNVYGNLHLTDGTNELYVYGCYSGYGATGDNRKGFIEKAGIKEGDELTMIGYKDTYKGLIELCGGIYFSHKSANAE